MKTGRITQLIDFNVVDTEIQLSVLKTRLKKADSILKKTLAYLNKSDKEGLLKKDIKEYFGGG